MSDAIITLGALALLIVAAYRGQSVILFAPIAAMLAVLLTDAAATPGRTGYRELYTREGLQEPPSELALE